MRRLIAISVACCTLTACGSDSAPEDEAASGEYTINQQSGETTATIQTEDGTATFRSGIEVPVDLPRGFSLYPGAKVTSNSRFDQDGGNRVVLLSFDSEADADDIASYYREAAIKAGYTIVVDAEMNGGRLITGEDKKGGVFTLSTSSEDGVTSAQLTTGLGTVAQ